MNVNKILANAKPLIVGTLLLIAINNNAQNTRIDNKKLFAKNIDVDSKQNLKFIPSDSYIHSESVAMAKDILNEYIEIMSSNIIELRDLGKKYGKNSARFRNRCQELFGMTRSYCLKSNRKFFDITLSEFGIEDIFSLPETDLNSAFRNILLKKYSTSEYNGCVFIGNIYQDESKFQQAKQDYINKRIPKKISESDSLNYVIKLDNEFRSKNKHISEITPGSIIGEYSPTATSRIHTQTYFGTGMEKDGKFVSNENGQYKQGGFNSERIIDVPFKNGVYNVKYMLDVEKILALNIEKHALQIKNQMTRDQLILDLTKDISDDKICNYLKSLTREELINLSLEKHFGIVINKENKNNNIIATNIGQQKSFQNELNIAQNLDIFFERKNTIVAHYKKQKERTEI